MSDTSLKRSPSKNGFSLAELLLAMLVFAIAITTILALLARSIETVDEILLKDEAMRLSGALENFFEETPFNDSYNILSSGDRLFTYMYRGDLNAAARADGTLVPYTSRDQYSDTGEQNFTAVPSVRRLTGATAPAELTADLSALQGRLFYVKLQISPNNPVDVGSMGANPDTYPSAVVVVFAEFYPVPTLETDVDAVGISPAYSYTFAVRR
jgi:Tfp pilus assembly protein PilV